MQRILFINFNPRSRKYIKYGFQDLGFDVAEYVNEYENMCYSLLDSKLNELINTFKPDMVFSYGWWENLENVDSFSHTLKKNGIFHVFWATDDPPCFQNMSLPIGRKADLVFTTAEEYIMKYEENFVKAYLLPFACDPDHHKALAPVKEFQHDLVLLGHNYNVLWNPQYFSYRLNGVNNILRPIVENGYDLRVWGLWWRASDRIYNLPEKNYGDVLPYENVPKVYSSSKIALGLQTVGDSKTMLSSRTFEALGCGAFHLSQYSPALETFFKKGVHLEWSESAEETLDIVKFYLQRDDARKKIARQGQQEVYARHTYKDRANLVMETVKNYLNGV